MKTVTTKMSFDVRVCDESKSEEEGMSAKCKMSREYPKKKLPKFPDFRAESNMLSQEFKLGLVFLSAKLFKDTIRECSIRVGK